MSRVLIGSNTTHIADKHRLTLGGFMSDRKARIERRSSSNSCPSALEELLWSVRPEEPLTVGGKGRLDTWRQGHFFQGVSDLIFIPNPHTYS